jgi:ribosome-associated protein
MLLITPNLSIPEDELHEEFLRSSGPGGQHVNKTATAVRLRFDAANSPSLHPPVRDRLLKLAGARATPHGEILIEVHEFRSQKQNREAARDRLTDLLRRAARPPKRRTKTKPTKGSKERRIEGKKARGQKKKLRRSPRNEE